jgi:cytochrome c oxidase assembly factor CtaG
MDMGGLDPLTWSTFFGTWHLDSWWLVAAVVLAGGYLTLHRMAGETSTVRPWRVASWVGGLALMWVCVASAIGAYSMSVFWMHMVLHLLLIMVVPILLVLGHPITVILESFPEHRQPAVLRVIRSWPVTVLSHQLFGTLLYAVVIIGTHLTGFMDQMAQHGWLMGAEQVLYVVTGYLFLLPLLGEEPTRPNPPYLLRLIILVIAMIPDTIVGIVLLQTSSIPFPVMMGMHPSWAPDHLTDVHTAGGLMWAGGDGGMMFIAMGLMISVITSSTRRTRMTGSWLEGVRRATLVEHVREAGAEAPSEPAGLDPDSDEAYEAYNRMLAELSRHDTGSSGR